MRTRSARIFACALAALILFVALDADALAQRRRTSRRATSPARTSPTPDSTSGEPSVVSTADEQQDETPRRTTRRSQQRDAQNAQSENDRLHGTVRDLSTQVEQLNGQINQLKTDQRAMYDLERLTRAEQRAEDLRTQLREITDKEFQYQERLAEIDYESQPDSIQRRAALIGSLNPSGVRDAIAQQLERERVRIRKQLELLGASHTRLEAAVATADAEVERLRARVDAADQAQQQSAPPATDNANAANTTAAPQPTPTPAQPPE
jgi:predicted RNase H-like nuclease (RuvC/YqgF family)